MEIGLELSNHGRIMLWRSIDRELLAVGSNPECDLCVPDKAVAPIQMLLRSDRDGLTLINRHPDGTQVGDERITDELRLAHGDEISLGPITATVRFVRGEGESTSKTRTLAQEAGIGDRPIQLVVSAPEALPGARWELVTHLTIGSDPKNDIHFDDPYVSGFHAQLSLEQGRCLVRDLGSRNGVYIHNQLVREAEVPVGSMVKIGKSIIVVTAADAGAAADGDPRPTTMPRMIGSSDAMDRVRQVLRRVAASDAPVLITGETGTGKEIAARLLVELSPRANAAHHTLNCGALGRNLIESELFGHEKGAFTGAIARKKGAFELADRGTLFLDEIGELPLELQPQLLRVVEYGEVRRVGGDEAFTVDVRLLAATNRKLEVEVAAGSFREDLFHRLHVLAVELPPLRRHKEDIPELTRHFIAEATRGAAGVTLSDEAMAKLTQHGWPGNVRELRNVMQRAVLMRTNDSLGVDDILFTPSTLATRVEAAVAVSSRTLAEIERDAIVAELIRHKGNKTDAAAALGVSRSTIHRKLEEFGIDLSAVLDR